LGCEVEMGFSIRLISLRGFSWEVSYQLHKINLGILEISPILTLTSYAISFSIESRGINSYDLNVIVWYVSTIKISRRGCNANIWIRWVIIPCR
jgi:hypothetical protein